MTVTELRSRLSLPRDGLGLGIFRALFGSILAVGVLRFWAKGWIETLYLEPSFHFTYLGFEWVRPWPGPWMRAHFAAMFLSAVALAIGYKSRLSAGVFCLLFTYVELIDKTAYLNHYYLISLVAGLLVIVPSGAAFSIDATAGGESRVPAWAYLLMRAQVGFVWVFAGLAKLNPDWLFEAQPLRGWLANGADLPLIGAVSKYTLVAYLMSWAGVLYDLTIPFWLAHARFRGRAFLSVVFFHGIVGWLFPIGIFSFVMVSVATLFFAPDWGRRWFLHRNGGAGTDVPMLSRLGLVALASYLILQVSVPLRFLFYPGQVNWTEESFRFAWRVMLIEKVGSVEFRVEDPGTGRVFRVHPRGSLTSLQYRMMSTQPDMIHQYALWLESSYRARGYRDVRVFADAWASLHGRPSQRLVDERFDLTSIRPSLWPSPFIVPLEASDQSELPRN